MRNGLVLSKIGRGTDDLRWWDLTSEPLPTPGKVISNTFSVA